MKDLVGAFIITYFFANLFLERQKIPADRRYQLELLGDFHGFLVDLPCSHGKWYGCGGTLDVQLSGTGWNLLGSSQLRS